MDSGKSSKTPVKRPEQKAAPQGRDTGAALRSAYQRTLDEDVPSDLLDLLGKLN